MIFCRDFGSRRMGFSPILCHRWTLFRKRSNAVSSVNIVVCHLSCMWACTHDIRIWMCRSVSMGVPRGTELSYPFFFMWRHIEEYEIGAPWLSSILTASCRVEIAVFRRTCCPMAVATLCVTLVGLPFPPLCLTEPSSLSFLRFLSIVRRGIFVFR